VLVVVWNVVSSFVVSFCLWGSVLIVMRLVFIGGVGLFL